MNDAVNRNLSHGFLLDPSYSKFSSRSQAQKNGDRSNMYTAIFATRDKSGSSRFVRVETENERP